MKVALGWLTRTNVQPDRPSAAFPRQTWDVWLIKQEDSVTSISCCVYSYTSQDTERGTHEYVHACERRFSKFPRCTSFTMSQSAAIMWFLMKQVYSWDCSGQPTGSASPSPVTKLSGRYMNLLSIPHLSLWLNYHDSNYHIQSVLILISNGSNENTKNCSALHPVSHLLFLQISASTQDS